MGRILVVGAGISGLSSALLLARAGHHVTIWARELTRDTTSNSAGAYWFPYLCNPQDKVVDWARRSYQYFENHLMSDGKGVRYVKFIECLRTQQPDPWWKPAIVNFARPEPDSLPPNYVDGYQGRSIVSDTSRYLPWLLAELGRRGVIIEQREVRSLDEALQQFPVVVNCSGLGSRELCGDDSVYPVRGQVVLARPNGIIDALADPDDDHFCYLVPRFADLVIGGTEQPHDWNRQPDPADTAEILRKARSILGEAEVTITGVKVGLRPVRDEIRLETEFRPNGAIVHNYGHGGAGYTLSWGCAQDVVAEVAQLS